MVLDAGDVRAVRRNELATRPLYGMTCPHEQNGAGPRPCTVRGRGDGAADAVRRDAHLARLFRADTGLVRRRVVSRVLPGEPAPRGPRGPGGAAVERAAVRPGHAPRRRRRLLRAVDVPGWGVGRGIDPAHPAGPHPATVVVGRQPPTRIPVADGRTGRRGATPALPEHEQDPRLCW